MAKAPARKTRRVTGSTQRKQAKRSALATTRAGHFFDTIPLSPVKTGLVGAGALLLCLLAVELFAGRFGELTPELARRLPRELRIAVVNALLLGYAVAANRSLRLATRRNAESLFPLLAESGAGGAAASRLAERACSPSPLAAHRAAWLAIALAVALSSSVNREGFATWFDPAYWMPETVWHWVTMLPIAWLIGWLTQTALHASASFAAMARQPVCFDLLDPRPLAPFVRQGLHTTLLWLGFVAILALHLMNRNFGVQVASLMGIAAVVSLASLLIPLLGIRRQLRERKAEELDWVRAEIRSDRDALEGRGATASKAAARLPGLLAYEKRVLEVNEWPIDYQARLRFGLYLVIPLGSWLGGAFVERMLSAALD